VTFFGNLVDAVNCDIAQEHGQIKLFTLSESNLPVFEASEKQILFPPSADSFFVNISLKSGSSRLGSVLAYELSCRQMNRRCHRTEMVGFIPQRVGQLRWKYSEHQTSLLVPIQWGNVDYCDQVQVSLKLTGIKSATVNGTDTVVAEIHGTPEGFCPPGTVNSRQSRRLVPFLTSDEQSLSLKEIRIEGLHSNTGVVRETALVPPFVANRENYTAMIPYDMRGTRLMLINEGSPDDIRVNDQTCSIDENLSWEEAVGEPDPMLQSEVEMDRLMQHCSLQVESFERASLSDGEFVASDEDDLDEISPATSESPVDEPQRTPKVFQVDFLQLSDPDVAVLESVEIRNATHVITVCGPRDTLAEEAAGQMMFEQIEGYPKRQCHIERINYVPDTLEGTEFIVIPRLKHPNAESTRLEVSGVLLDGNPDSQNRSSTALDMGSETVMATVFEGVHLANASLSFDIRVTAADNVTSNLYRFVYGKRNSVYQLFAAGSSFDMEQEHAEERSENVTSTRLESKRWCEECSVGTFSIGVDALQCALCEPGHYADHSGSSYCKECPEGTFTYTWGSEMCRPCMFGSAANKPGSQYCELCPDGYITDKEGAAHCTVPVKFTDLRRYYAVIASFRVVLNGTSLQEIERLGKSVHASGVVVLKMLVRTDMADALNISVGDVAVTSVTPVGRHALSIYVDTTFKVEVPADADPEEVDREVKATMLKGDDAVREFANNPDRVLKRTTRATHARANVNRDSAKFRASNPSEWSEDRWYTDPKILYPLVSVCILFVSSTFLICVRIRKHKSRLSTHLKSFAWFALQDRSESSSNGSGTQIAAFGLIRHRTFSSRPNLDP